jgi:hypothetical protein
MDPEITARAQSTAPLTLYEASSFVKQNARHPVRLYQVAEMIRKHRLHKAHPTLSWLQPPVLYRACFLMLPTYAPPVLAMARGLVGGDFFETERMCLGIFDVPTYDPETGTHRTDHGTTLEAFAIVAKQYPVAIKATPDDPFHRLRDDSIRRSMAMAERVLAILETGLIPPEALTRAHLLAGVDAARVLSRCLAVHSPVTDVRASYEAQRRGLELVRRMPDGVTNQKDAQELAEGMALIRFYFPHRTCARRGWIAGPEEQRQWADIVRYAFRPGPAASVRNPPKLPKTGKLRIGYISPDFRSNAVGWFLTPLLSQFDPARFEVYVYNNHTGDLHNDPARLMFRSMPVNWFESGKFTEDTLVDVLHTHNLDVLVDLLCYHRPTLLARKPVEHILNYLGFPERCFIDGVQGRVVDAITDPVELEGDNLTRKDDPERGGEELVRMPRCFVCFSPMSCYGPYPIEYRPPQVPGTLRIGIFNKSAKFTPSIVRAWRRILELRPGAELWFKRDERYMDADVWEEFRDMFGPMRKRVRGLPFSDHVRTYFDYHNQIDLALDTWPYAGTTTTCSALYMGVPVITVCGRGHVERVTQSILEHAGLGEWVCGREEGPPPLSIEAGDSTDPQEPDLPHAEAYIQAAVHWPLPEDREREQARRERLREQFMRAMDPKEFMRDWEDMLVRVAGRAPEAEA